VDDLGAVTMDGLAISFGPFRLFAEQRLLLEGDRPVRLGSRAFDILAALVERPGEVVGKEQLIARAWPQTFVEESNLKIQVSALRRALGDGQGGNRYVITVPGRGYNFVAPVRREKTLLAAPTPSVPITTPHSLPLAATRMIGRDDAVAALVTRLSRQRLVTIVGAGGIGKTTLALAVAERLMAGYEHGVWLVDLAPLGDPSLAASAVAAVLGLEIRAEDPLPGLVASLRDNRMLLLLDNCEHVIDAAAGLTAAILKGTPGVSILATSREPLGTAGEREYRLGPLAIPQESSRLTAAEAASFPAVQLFVERAGAIVEDFVLTDANASAAVAICRRLDGLPLAIEFAAPRVEVLGVEGLAARLNDSLQLLGTRRRTTIPRHRTMRAVVDWSYGLLSGDEQLFFRALGIFRGDFTVEAAASVAMDAADTCETIDRLADLVAKSLVVANVSGTKSRFRLLDTTRAYAIEKLDESGEREQIARCHAEYYHHHFERAEDETAARPVSEWLADYAPEIDNLRAALDWTYSSDGDAEIAVALTVAAIPLWVRLSLHKECRSRAKQALGTLGPRRSRDPRKEMKLHAALGTSTAEAPEMGAAFAQALEIAEGVGDTEYQLRALGGLFFFRTASNRHRAALPLAQSFHDLAAIGSDLSAQLFGEHIIGLAKHFLGDQASARRHLEQALTRLAADQGREVTRFQIDTQMSTLAFLARVLWLQGFLDQAVRTAEKSIERAQATGNALSQCYALALAACPIALWTGNLAAAAQYSGMLFDESTKHGLPLWSELGARFKSAVVLRGGGPVTGSRLLQAGPDEIAEPDVRFQTIMGLTELAEALAQAGRVAEGLAMVDAGLALPEIGWRTLELLRLKGELFLLQSNPAVMETVEDLFRQALDGARRQETLSCELRAATSLARLLSNQDRHRRAEAIACLQPVYERFTEGFGTADLVAAKRLLDELGDAGHR
jgi:predicted ATPase/DNA-binding winged helix-turn-helix (wHTH) protein